MLYFAIRRIYALVPEADFVINTIDFDSLKSVYTLDNFEMNHIEGFHIKYGQSKTKSRFTNTAKSTALSMG